jgi:hypothetical protein
MGSSRSLLVIVLLAGSAAADPLVDRIVGKSYEVTTTYIQGIPPDCGGSKRPCPPAKTKAVTRVVTVRADDVVITYRQVHDHDKTRDLRCADLAAPASPDPEFPHVSGPQKVTPRGGAPKLPLCEP